MLSWENDEGRERRMEKEKDTCLLGHFRGFPIYRKLNNEKNGEIKKRKEKEEERKKRKRFLPPEKLSRIK